MNWGNLVYSIAISFAALFWLDFIIYSARSAPKNSTLHLSYWAAGFVGTVYIIYRLLP